MPVLILLNGPPASGKSTLAVRLAALRPLTLSLDIDVIRHQLGGWFDRPLDAGLAARRLALSMIDSHLGTGHDVVVPQFLARVEFIDQLEAAARTAGAVFVEVSRCSTRRPIRRARSGRRDVRRTAIATPAAARLPSNRCPARRRGRNPGQDPTGARRAQRRLVVRNHRLARPVPGAPARAVPGHRGCGSRNRDDRERPRSGRRRAAGASNGSDDVCALTGARMAPSDGCGIRRSGGGRCRPVRLRWNAPARRLRLRP